jgi:hypothetical protein
VEISREWNSLHDEWRGEVETGMSGCQDVRMSGRDFDIPTF